MYFLLLLEHTIVYVPQVASTSLPTSTQERPSNSRAGGTVYTRWGSSSCPNISGTELVYSGRAGGSFFTDTGGGANYLCLPDDPEYTLPSKPGIQREGSIIYGAEYQYPVTRPRTYYYNVPCAVCMATTRETVLMIPAKTSCPSSWTREYEGYLMSAAKYAAQQNNSRTMFECVDKDQEILSDSQENTNGALFWHVEADCTTGLRCPPYNEEKEINCVVCTK